jgi:hypothetical protein
MACAFRDCRGSQEGSGRKHRCIGSVFSIDKVESRQSEPDTLLTGRCQSTVSERCVGAYSATKERQFGLCRRKGRILKYDRTS